MRSSDDERTKYEVWPPSTTHEVERVQRTAKLHQFSRRSIKLSLLDITPKERINIYPKTFVVIIRSVLLTLHICVHFFLDMFSIDLDLLVVMKKLLV